MPDVRLTGFVGRDARPREYAKLAVRRMLYKRRLDLVSDPLPVRVATMIEHLGLDTVLDVGANIGQYASALRASGFAGPIISCEPLSDAFDHLRRRSAADPSWTALHTAVGAEAGTLSINVSANSFSSSLLPMTNAHSDAAPGSEFVGTEAVPVTTVAEIVHRHGVDPRRSLLKVDTQGYEPQVLAGAGELVGRFAAIALELSFVPLYAGQQLFGEQTERMRAAGYTLYGVEGGFSDPRSGRMLQCDGLFVLDELAGDR